MTERKGSTTLSIITLSIMTLIIKTNCHTELNIYVLQNATHRLTYMISVVIPSVVILTVVAS